MIWAMKVARERAASAASTRDEGEIVIWLSVDMDKNWGVIIVLLVCFGGVLILELIMRSGKVKDVVEFETFVEAENVDVSVIST